MDKPKISYSEFKKLLELQKQQVGTASSAPSADKVLQAGKDVEQVKEGIEAQKETSQNIKELVKLTKDSVKGITEIAKQRQGLTLKEKIGGGLQEKFGSLRGLLDTVGVVKKGSGGFIDRALERREEDKKFIKGEQALTGATKEQAVEKLKQIKEQEKSVKSVDRQIQTYTKLGISEKVLAGTEQGKALLDKRGTETAKLAALDYRVNDSVDLTAADTEKENEIGKREDLQTKLLEQIAANTGGVNKPAAAKPVAPSEGAGGGMLDGITSFISNGLLKAFKFLFNPANLLKAITKVFAPAMIIGSLVSGIMDGFEAWKETGSIKEALIAGLAGVLEFLSFGLLDAEKIKEVINKVVGFVNEYIIEPIGKFFDNVKNGILNMVSKLGIPEVKFKIPVINKEVSVGPFYPFAGLASSSNASPTTPPAAPTPNQADQVYNRSSENAKSAIEPVKEQPASVVSAPTVNNVTRQNNIIRTPIRNQESSVSSYLKSRYA